MKGEVARAGTGLCLHKGRVVRAELALLRVEAIAQQFVRAEVGGESVAISGIEHDTMRVRLRLALMIYACALMLRHRCGCAETAIDVDGQDGDIPARVVCDQDKTAGTIYRHITRRAALRRLLIQ